ncbi:MAG: DapH/DapD/GlmU-related protein [Acidimicrobiia bacterium]
MNAAIHDSADVEAGASVGAGTRVWRNVHIRAGAKVGKECVIGGGAFIDTDVQIGDRVKIENNAMLFAPARVEDGAFIGPGACLTNDPRPRAVTPDGQPKDQADWHPDGVVVGEGASVGAMSVVLPGVVIGPWSMIGAGATVTRDVPAHGLAVGNPARLVGWACLCGRTLDDQLICSCGRTYEKATDGLVLV